MRTSIAGIFLIVWSVVTAQNNSQLVGMQQLSNQAKASLLTVGCGTEVYQLFGHTAIRIKDEKLGWDVVFNYGTFDFGDPKFLQKFIKGKLLYYESVDTYIDFEQNYREENRWIREQLLNIDSTQVKQLFNYLTVNAREENKYYQYDFLFDNCSTRPRDVILKLLVATPTKNNIKLGKDKDDKTTYRALIDRHVPNEWLDFGMDLLIGLRTDKASGIGRTFLPYELMQLLDNTTYNNKPLVITNTELLAEIPNYRAKQWLTPGLVFWCLFLIVFYLQIKSRTMKNWRVFPVIYFSCLGILGWFLLFMWLGTDHQSTKWNLNILWAMPLNMPLIFWMVREQKSKWIEYYLIGYRILLILLLCCWALNLQQYHVATIPIILLAILLISRFIPIPSSK